MLSINNLTFHFGGRTLYDQASLHIKPKDRIGLIGYNGAGKSTLLRIITKEYTPDEGSVTQSKDCTIGFLNQDLLSFVSSESILTVALQAFEKENKLLHEINVILKKLETEYSDDLINKLSTYQEQFEAAGGYTLQAKAEEILEGLGFKSDELQKPLNEFSGGWRMRVMLAKILLATPSLLLLDEPTNHLDLPSIEWLEKYIKNYDGAVVIVSHDQEFLNNVVTSIAEVSQMDINLYAGNYDFYTEERELRREIQQNAFQNQQKKIKDTEDFINRFRAKATKSKQVQSRVKALDRMDKISEVVDENRLINMNFTFTKPSGKVVLDLRDVSKSFGDKLIFKSSDITILREDKIALIGANGKGKSTLLRIIRGTEAIGGEREEGHNVSFGFYAQHQLEALNLTHNILEELKHCGSDKTEQELRNIAGCFLFGEDDIVKNIKVLSGGEKSRVALAKTLISEANFLLLDEPTNHLDIQSVNILVQALKNYEGSFIIVSHDRHFITRVATKIWYIEDHYIKEYPGTYEEFNIWKEKQSHLGKKEVPTEKSNKETKLKSKPKTNTNKTNLFQLQQKLAEIEKDIEQKEVEKTIIEKDLEKTEIYTNPELLSEKSAEFQKTEKKLNELNKLWEELALEIDEYEN